jgi:hypothetical protein
MTVRWSGRFEITAKVLLGCNPRRKQTSTLVRRGRGRESKVAPRIDFGGCRGPQRPAGEQAVGIPRRGPAVGTGYGDALVISHGEGGVPAES